MMMWTPDRISEMRLMADRKLSSGEIAEHFGITRNAVAGKCHREGIKLCSSPETQARRCSDGHRASWAGGKRHMTYLRGLRAQTPS